MDNFSLIVFLLSIHFCVGENKININLPLRDLITYNGYNLEEYEVETEDGYLVTIFRMNKGNSSAHMNVVIMVHGLMGSAENYISLGPEKGLGFLFADKGYDVWLLNMRGTLYGRKHRKINPNSKKFWYFSWEEMAIYDIPAFLKQIEKVTNKNDFIYVGHSQGGAVFSIFASELPEYQNRIKLGILLAPAVYITNIRVPLARLLAPQMTQLMGMVDALNLYELLPFGLNNVVRRLCSTNIRQLCMDLLKSIDGDCEIEEDVIKSAMKAFPGGCSIFQFVQFGQSLISDNFRKFDYGEKENLVRYNSVEPPPYNITNIKAPVAIYYSESDNLVTDIDSERLAKTLPNVVAAVKVPNDITHFGFVLQKNVHKLVYDHVFEIVNTIEGK